jgi:hypothetical protein
MKLCIVAEYTASIFNSTVSVNLKPNSKTKFKPKIIHSSVPVPHSKSGVVPRSSLLGAGQLGFWEVGKGGTIG